MKWVAVLVLSVLTGLLIGAQLNAVPESGRSSRLPRRSQALPMEDVASQPTPRREAVAGRPEEGRPVSYERLGSVEVDFGEYPGRAQAWILPAEIARSVVLDGEIAIEGEADDEDRLVKFEMPPGTYLVWWESADHMDSVGTHVRVEPGKVTRVHASAGRKLPVAQGLGRLDVQILAPEGGEGASGVWVNVLRDFGVRKGDYAAPPRVTNSAGRCAFELLPGPYRVAVHRREERIDVIAGRTTTLELRHENEGGLEIALSPRDASLGLRLFDSAKNSYKPSEVRKETGVYTFVLVPAGSYEVVGRIKEGYWYLRRFGRVEIVPRRTTYLDAELPLGGLRVLIDASTQPDGLSWKRSRVAVKSLEASGRRSNFFSVSSTSV